MFANSFTKVVFPLPLPPEIPMMNGFCIMMFIKKFVKTNQSKLSYLFLVKIFTMQLLDGKKLATEIKLEIAEEVRKIKAAVKKLDLNQHYSS